MTLYDQTKMTELEHASTVQKKHYQRKYALRDGSPVVY